MRVENKTLSVLRPRCENGHGGYSPLHGPLFSSESEAISYARNNPKGKPPQKLEGTSGSEISYSRLKQRSDVQRSVMSNGWRPPLPYVFDKSWDGMSPTVYAPRIQHYPQGRAVQGWPNWKYQARSAWVHRNASGRVKLTAPQRILDSQKHLVENDAMSDIKNESFNAAQAMVEARQNIALAATYIRRIAGLVRSVRRRDPSVLTNSYQVLRKRSLIQKRRNMSEKEWKRYRSSARKSADLWLETMYGLRPMVYDAQGAIEQSQRSLRENQLVVARRSRHAQETQQGIAAVTLYGVNSTYSGRLAAVELSHTSTRTDKCSLWFKVSDPNLVLAKEMGFTNLAAVAWDSVPLWSLLVDWVLPIGDYLRLLGYDKGLSFLGGSYTEFNVTTTSVVRAYGIDALPDLILGSDGIAAESVYFRRSPYIYGSPQPHKPRIRNPFRTERAISSVALLRQRLNFK